MELGLDIEPKYIQITGVTVGSINVHYIVLAPIAAFENTTLALTALATQAAAGTLAIGGAQAATTQAIVVHPDMSLVPSPCKKGFSLGGDGACASNLCAADERVSNNECVACDATALEFHEAGALQGYNDTTCTPGNYTLACSPPFPGLPPPFVCVARPNICRFGPWLIDRLCVCQQLATFRCMSSV